MPDLKVGDEAPIGVLDREGHRVELFLKSKHLQVRWAGRIIADTRKPILLRESGYVPTWYVPKADIDPAVLHDSEHRTYCPYKGEAHYWSLASGEQVSDDSVWHYPAPFPELAALKDYAAFYADKVETIVEEGRENSAAGDSDAAELAVGTAGGGAVFDWLLQDAWQHAGPRELSESFVRLLRAEDPDLVRFFVGVYVVHPMVRAMGYNWEAGAESDAVNEFEAPHTAAPTDDWLKSPLRPLLEDGLSEIRFDLTDAGAIAEFPLLRRLREGGATDYLALAMPHANRMDALAVATARASGFDSKLVSDLRRAVPLLGRLYAYHGLDRTAHTLLDTYIGPHAAERVFYGQVKRGDGEDIRAAIWFCDLRQFTQISESLPRGELISLLNDYFSMVTDAVRRNGGEVLKFIGDAVLAIFPIGFSSDVQAVCQAAYRAALDARIAVSAFNLARLAQDSAPIDFGVSLHIGDVLYGNIGAPDRMDFTVIGPAVNLVTRIEALSDRIGERILMTEAFTEAASIPAQPHGPFSLKGIANPQMVFSAEPVAALVPVSVAAQQTTPLA